MADITPARRSVCETNLSIEIGTIKIHLTTIIVDNLACLSWVSLDQIEAPSREKLYILHASLKHAKGGGISDHQSRQVVLVHFCLILEVGKV
jgi:hypothetical protein